MNNKKLNRNVMAASIAMALAASAPNVFANEIEEMVVVGSFSASLQNALNAKRASTAAVDSIVADDIASFPDNNLAESLQRIPGINIDRVGGEGKQISVRGLSADFTRVRINGMETISTGHGNGGRAFDFNIFASELFNRIDVHKSQSARIDEGSLGATVDLSTGKPFDYDNQTLVLNAQGGYNTESKSFDPRISGLASFKNDDDTLGASFSLAYSERNVDQGGHNSGRFEANKTGNNRWANHADLPAEVNGAVHPRFPRQLDREIETERLGMTGALQWRPTDQTLVNFDLLYGKIDQERRELTLTPISLARTGSTGRIETTVNDYYYDADTNALLYADLSGVDVRNESFRTAWNTEFTQFSLSLEHEFTENLKGSLMVGQSKSVHERPTESTVIFEKFNQDFSYDYRNSGTNPILKYGFDVSNPDGYYVSELRDQPMDTENEFETLRADLSYDFSVGSVDFTLQGGISYKEFSFDNLLRKRDAAIINQGNHTNLALTDAMVNCGFELSDFAVTADMGSVIKAGNGQSWFFPNAGKIFDQYNYHGNDACFPLVTDQGSDREVIEESMGEYVQLNFSTEVGGIPVRGDFGVRHVKTDQTSLGLVAGENRDVKRDYSDTLPAVNLVIEPIENVLLRAAWSEVMARPTLSSLTPGGSASGVSKAVNVGNPYLNPFSAEAFDLSVEWYFADNATLSVAYFQKEISSFIQSRIQYYSWGELKTMGFTDAMLSTFPAEDGELFEYKDLHNGEGGELEGWEIQFQTPFNFGPEWLHNFGVRLNYTDITSEVVTSVDSVTKVKKYSSLLGQSDVSYNGTLWYEKDSFSARVSLSYRDPFTTAYTTTAGPGTAWTDESTYVDAAMSYRVNDNLKVTLDMLNLTDELEVAKMSDYGILDTSINSGRQFYMGVQYTF